MIGIIPAAGYGTRLHELGKAYPKSILPYKERPLLVHNVEWLRSQGCSDIVIVVNHQRDKIQGVVDQYDLEVSIAEVEVEGGGLSKSILAGLTEFKSKGDQSVLILLGDLLVRSGEMDLTNNSVSTFTVEDWSRWCMVDSDGKFYDKPTDRPPTDQALSGVYHLLSSGELEEKIGYQIRDDIRINGELQFSTVLSQLNQPVTCSDLVILDFGTLSDFLKNRGLRNSRSFNRVEIWEDSVIKKSSMRSKIISELNWYRSLPVEIVTRTPRILDFDLYGDGGASYTMQRVLDPTLRELYLFLNRDTELWTKIFTECFDTHQKMRQYRSDSSSKGALLKKTNDRANETGHTGSQLVQNFLWDLSAEAEKFETHSCLVHGDLCFSNMMWDNSSNRITMLDPRGEIFYSPYYDIAKLRHSIFGYDFIDAELYTVNEGETRLFDDGTEHIRELYFAMERERFSPEVIRYLDLLTASLFLSMIPLHSHNSQNQELFYGKFKEIVSVL